jgi:serine/threonine protein kinase
MILDHPNLVPIYDITYNSDGKPKTIEMPLVKGTALFNNGEFIKGIESDSQKWAVAKQVCSGLNHMHEKGLVHRDVQAKNIIVNEQGNAFLCDMDSAFLEGMAIEKAPDYLIPPELRFTKEEQRRIIEENRKSSGEVISLTEIEYPKGPVTEKFDSWQYGLFLADLFLDGKIGENSELDLSGSCMTFMTDEKLQKEYEGNLGSYLCSDFNIENPLKNMLIRLLDFDPTTRLSLSNLDIN